MAATIDYGGLQGVIRKNILLLFLIIAVFMIPAGCSGSSAKTKQIRSEMSEYLKNSYGIEFELGKLMITYHPIYGYYTYEAKAHPKGQPELEFRLWANNFDYKNSTDNYKGSYTDDYLPALWSYQGEQDLEKTLKKLYNNSFFLNSYSFDNLSKKYKDLHYSELIKEYKGLLSIRIKYLVFTDNKIDKKQEAERVYKILNTYIIPNESRRYWIIVYYFPARYKSESRNLLYKKEKLKDGTKMYKAADDLYKENEMINHIDFRWPKFENTKEGFKESKYKPVEVNDIVSAFKY